MGRIEERVVGTYYIEPSAHAPPCHDEDEEEDVHRAGVACVKLDVMEWHC